MKMSQLPHLRLLLFAILLGPSYLASGGEAQSPFLKKYLDTMEGGIKCHSGFITLSQRMKDSAVKCSKMKEIKDYSCFLLCVYKEFGYFSKNDKGGLDLDHGMAAIVTQESFDLSTKSGRDEYFQLGRTRYDCAQDLLVKKGVVLPDSFEDKTKCEGAKEFFSCSFKSLTCGKGLVE